MWAAMSKTKPSRSGNVSAEKKCINAHIIGDNKSKNAALEIFTGTVKPSQDKKQQQRFSLGSARTYIIVLRSGARPKKF